MKKFFVFVIGLTCASLNLMAARTSSKKRTSLNTTSSVKLKDPSETECRENIDYCFNRYCFDKKTQLPSAIELNFFQELFGNIGKFNSSGVPTSN